MSAPATVTVSVTQEHIDAGEPGVCRGCAVALALADTFPGTRDAKVTYDDSDDATSRTVATVWTAEWIDRHFVLDRDGEKFVADFDDGFPVGPLTFTMTEVTS